MNNFKKKAFTLAEVLITLSIIGVVAAMTIPTLISNVQDQEYKTMWKKSYAEVDSAVRMVMTNNGGTLSGLCEQDKIDAENCLKSELIKYLNTSTSCDAGGDGDNNCCYDLEIKYLNGGPAGWSMDYDGAGIVLTNGAMLNVYFDPQNPNNGQGPIVGEELGAIFIDTNGIKNPNQMGKDVFWVHITKTGIKPSGTQGDGNDKAGPDFGCDLDADTHATGDTCAADCLMDKNCNISGIGIPDEGGGGGSGNPN